MVQGLGLRAEGPEFKDSDVRFIVVEVFRFKPMCLGTLNFSM